MWIKIMKIIRFIPIISFFASFIMIARLRPDSKEILKICGMMLIAIPIFLVVSAMGFIIPQEIAQSIASLTSVWAVGFAWGTYAVKEMEKASKR